MKFLPILLGILLFQNVSSNIDSRNSRDIDILNDQNESEDQVLLDTVVSEEVTHDEKFKKADKRTGKTLFCQRCNRRGENCRIGLCILMIG